MILTFENAKQMYQADQIEELASSSAGLRFLLLKSLDRPNYQLSITARTGIPFNQLTGRARLKNLFESDLSTEDIKSCLIGIYHEERLHRRAREKSLISELYKMKAFDWGGLHQNSLETTIVDSYVKKIADFRDLNNCIENEIFSSMRGYVQCSWYNHWTTVLIEDIFNDQDGITPAVGKIKKIDFFVDNQPFDLKVTYLPEGFIKMQRKLRKLRPELTLLKHAAKQAGIQIDENLSEARLIEQLWSMVADSPTPSGLITELMAFRESLVDDIHADPEDLTRWLYENQGIRRFDASNRLFLVLVNTRNYFDSWKLKRSHTLLADRISTFVANRSRMGIGRKIEFQWEGKTHAATSATLLVIHDS